jgi:DNA-binding IclR family transcriptional regulator
MQHYAIDDLILKILSRYRHKSCSLKEISELVQVNKTSCLRILRTLEREDLIKYDRKSKEYSLAPYLIPLGKRALELNPNISTATSELTVIAQHTRLTAVLVRRISQNRVMYLAADEPPGNHPKISVSIGQHVPIAAVSFGRCFIAYDDEIEWEHFVELGLVSYTTHSIVDPMIFVQTLRQIRHDGYSISRGSLTPGLSAIAAPIFNREGNVELVVACLAMTSELNATREMDIVQTILESTRKLSAFNGYQGQHDEHPFEDYGW